jgi:CubicO group peptidase (beta-lactamase class C family)
MPRIFFCKSFLTLIAVTVAVIFFGLTICKETPPPNFWISAAPANARESPPEASREVDDPRFAAIGNAVQDEIDAGQIPGAVVLVGQGSQVVYCKAFGHRSLEPPSEPMTVDTIFDIASLTKVVATTPAIMQLGDCGRLSLDDPVAKYWPEFGQNGKSSVTLRQLLTHTSGLRQGIEELSWSGYKGGLEVIAMDRLYRDPSTFRYSDVDFMVLGEIVQRVSGKDLKDYCTEKIFKPLKMRQTSFKPPPDWQPLIAPCIGENKNDLRWGEVQDPVAYRLDGVAGNAGVFSTAHDLAVFAQMMLDRGRSGVLSSTGVAAMTKPLSFIDWKGQQVWRGLGWDILSPFSTPFTNSFPQKKSYGHTGHTGTSIWIDPGSKNYLIILTTNLQRPKDDNPFRPLRENVAAAVAAALGLEP